MEDEKYQVYKVTDIMAFREKFQLNQPFQECLDALEEQLLDDAVVIRTQDAFAASGLSAYARNIEFYLSMAAGLKLEARQRLDMISEYFRQVAQEAEDRLARGECKLPT